MVMIWFQNLSSETMYLSLNVYYMYKGECGEMIVMTKEGFIFCPPDNNIQNILLIMTPNNNHNNNNIPWCKFWYRQFRYSL